MWYDTKANSAAILMVPHNAGWKGTVNPLKPEGYWLHEPKMIGYVMRQSDKLELWTSHGELADWELGSRQLAHHDQSRITKFTWTVVGIVRWNGDGNPPEVLAGEVPSRKIKHGVFK